MRGQHNSAKPRFAARHALAPAVVGCLLGFGANTLCPGAGHAESALKCVNNDTMSEVGEELTKIPPQPRRLAPQQIYRRNTWTDPNRQHVTFLSFGVSSDGKAGFRIMDIPEPAVTHAVTRIATCITER